MKILISAYACEPDRGSEPAVGWNIALQAARFHEVWVLTRRSNQVAIERELKKTALPRVHWEFFDPPRGLSFWKRGTRGLLPFHYLWQIGAYRRARALHSKIQFDLVHHVTLTQYWTPSYLSLLGIPFVWGPLGGGDRTPEPLLGSLDWRGKLAERRRDLMQRICSADPFLRAAARRTSLALASTKATCEKLVHLGCERVEDFGCLGLSLEELDSLGRLRGRSGGPLRILSSGRLIYWKGFHLGIAAFARFQRNFPGSEYWICGDGVERHRLSFLAQQLSVEDRVKFFGEVDRTHMLGLLGNCDVLVHPSFHDSGAMVCTEAMAAGRPVICLNLGGPGLQVTEETGFRVAPQSPSKVIVGIADAMAHLAKNPEQRQHMGAAARLRARANYSWNGKGSMLETWYQQIAGGSRRSADIPGQAAV